MCSGVSSTVRRCLDKESNIYYAVKIIELVPDDSTVEGDVSSSTSRRVEYQLEELRESTFKEIYILKMCKGHPNISECRVKFFI